MTSTIATRITANIDVVVAAVLATDPRGAALGREGSVATTLLPPPLTAACYKVGLQTSYTGVGAMLNPISVRPLSKSTGQSYSKKDSTARSKRNKERYTRM